MLHIDGKKLQKSTHSLYSYVCGTAAVCIRYDSLSAILVFLSSIKYWDGSQFQSRYCVPLMQPSRPAFNIIKFLYCKAINLPSHIMQSKVNSEKRPRTLSQETTSNHSNVFTFKSPWSLVRNRTIPTSDRRLSAKLVPTFADRGCRVVSATDPRPLFRFSWPEPLLFHSSSSRLHFHAALITRTSGLSLGTF
jgi:hypothetical protein